MSREHSERWTSGTDYLRSQLAGIEIAAQAGNPDYTITFPPSIQVPASNYLSAVQRYGSPAFSERELATKGDGERAYADGTVAAMLGLSLESPPGKLRTLECSSLPTSGFTGLTLIKGGFTITNEGEAGAEVFLSRFAESPSVKLGQLEPGETRSLTIPADRSDRPWALGYFGDGPIQLCTTGPG